MGSCSTFQPNWPDARWPMLILLKTFFHDLLFSPDAAKGYLRGFALFLGTLAATFAPLLTALPTEKVNELLSSPKELILYSLPALLTGFAGMVRAGDKTPQNVKDLASKQENGG